MMCLMLNEYDYNVSSIYAFLCGSFFLSFYDKHVHSLHTRFSFHCQSYSLPSDNRSPLVHPLEKLMSCNVD